MFDDLALKNGDMEVSWNRGTPKSSTFSGFSIINHSFWGTTIYGNPHIPVGKLIPGPHPRPRLGLVDAAPVVTGHL